MIEPVPQSTLAGPVCWFLVSFTPKKHDWVCAATNACRSSMLIFRRFYAEKNMIEPVQQSTLVGPVCWFLGSFTLKIMIEPVPPSTLAGPVGWLLDSFTPKKTCFCLREGSWGITYSLSYILETYFFLFQGHFRHLLFCSLLHVVLGWQYNPGHRRTLIKGKKKWWTMYVCSLLHVVLGWQYNPGHRRTLVKGKKIW